MSNEADVLQTYEKYIDYFLSNDIAGVNSLVEFPITYISDGHCLWLDAFPVTPDAIRKEKGWDTTIDVNTLVHGVSATKAHVISTGTRIREDKSVIERYSAFYAFHKKGSEWKMFAISDVILD